MDNIRKKEYYYILLAIAGAAMFIISLLKGTSDSYWPGMGLGFVIIPALRLVPFDVRSAVCVLGRLFLS